MLFNALDFFIILTTTAIFTLASPIQLDSTSHLEIRAGPSGSLNYPYGGETFDNTNGLGKLPVSYNQVSPASLTPTSLLSSKMTILC